MENYIAVKRCFRFPLNVVFDVMGCVVIILKQGDNCSVRLSPVIEVLWPDILLQIITLLFSASNCRPFRQGQ